MRYGIDFRKRVLEYSKTHILHETAKVFGISVRIISEWKKRLKETGSLAGTPRVRKAAKLDRAKLVEYVRARPDAYLREIAAEFKVNIETVRRVLLKLGFTQKKRQKCTKSGTRRGERNIPKQYRNIKKKS